MCLATGFHPKTLQLTWMRNKQEMSENVEKRETLPNADGTFQKRCVLTIPPGKRWKYQYTCALKDKSGLIVEMPLEDGKIKKMAVEYLYLSIYILHVSTHNPEVTKCCAEKE